MKKLRNYTLFFVLLIALGYALSIRPDGSYFSSFAELIKKKGESEKFVPEHTLDLEKYRPNIQKQN